MSEGRRSDGLKAFWLFESHEADAFCAALRDALVAYCQGEPERIVDTIDAKLLMPLGEVIAHWSRGGVRLQKVKAAQALFGAVSTVGMRLRHGGQFEASEIDALPEHIRALWQCMLEVLGYEHFAREARRVEVNPRNASGPRLGRTEPDPDRPSVVPAGLVVLTPELALRRMRELEQLGGMTLKQRKAQVCKEYRVSLRTLARRLSGSSD